jgi:hypothetical protein
VLLTIHVSSEGAVKAWNRDGFAVSRMSIVARDGAFEFPVSRVLALMTASVRSPFLVGGLDHVPELLNDPLFDSCSASRCI